MKLVSRSASVDIALLCFQEVIHREADCGVVSGIVDDHGITLPGEHLNRVVSA